MYEFETKLSGPDIDLNNFVIPDRHWMDIDTLVTATVKWSVEIETRSWGIKSIIASVHSVEVTVEWSVGADHLDEEEKKKIIAFGGTEKRNGDFEGTQNFTVTEYKGESDEVWGIVNDLKNNDDTFTVDNLEVNFKSKTTFVS